MDASRRQSRDIVALIEKREIGVQSQFPFFNAKINFLQISRVLVNRRRWQSQQPEQTLPCMIRISLQFALGDILQKVTVFNQVFLNLLERKLRNFEHFLKNSYDQHKNSIFVNQLSYKFLFVFNSTYTRSTKYGRKAVVKSHFQALEQWFPTGVPWHTRVPQRGVRGAAKFRITAFYYRRCRQIVILTNKGCRQIFLKT